MTNNLDNHGSGFSLDDGDDLETMFGRAASASEEDESNNFSEVEMPTFDFDDDETVTSTPTESSTELTVENEAAAPESTDLESFMEELDQDTQVVDEAPTEPEEENEVTEAVESRKSRRTTNSAPKEEVAKPKVKVPTEADQIEDAARVIRILDAYRALSNMEKTVTVQFVTNGAMEEADESTLVVKVLNADPMLTATMRHLREAHECEAVERAFYTMSLETKMLHALGALVSVFTEDDIDETLPNLSFSRAVVAAIATLGETEIGYVRATESVLASAEKPTELNDN